MANCNHLLNRRYIDGAKLSNGCQTTMEQTTNNYGTDGKDTTN
ncbi:MAG: hypothetical protein NTY74_06455 [Ignavibacteriae bacterium]|nr:hypothetical protein [Ignavibacteriota bacterium]